jgi:hypothetical protein
LTAAATVFSAAAGVFLATWSGKLRAQGESAAFTVEYLNKSYDRTTNSEVTSRVIVYARRSDGSYVELTLRVNNEPRGVKRVVDTASWRAIAVDPLTRSTTTYRLTEAEVRHLQAPRGACTEHPGLTLDPTAQHPILGYDVVHFTGKLPGSEHSIEKWYAPALNCLLLRAEWYTDGFRNTQVTSSIVLGEPDASLYTIPGDYVERTPSEVLALASAQQGNPVSPNAAGTASALDSVYHGRQVGQ